MDLTSHAQLQQWLISVLGSMGGAAPRAAALDRIDAIYGASLTPDDRDPSPSRSFEPKWRNRVSWQRDKMVRAGLLDSFAGRGTPWRLTELGWVEYEEMQPPPLSSDALINFKPKDDSDYSARIVGRTLTKRRSHETLIADFGVLCMKRHFVADTGVHPRDLVLRRGTEQWLVEAKVLHMGNATDAVRAALAQLLMYQHFLHTDVMPHLVALFSEPIGHAYVSFLEQHDVISVWRSGSGWEASSGGAALVGS